MPYTVCTASNFSSWAPRSFRPRSPICLFPILARAGATNVLLVTFLIPVSAILLGTLILGEQLAAPHLGMVAIALGLAAIDGRLMRRYRVGTGFSPR